jgi:translation initiation factor 2-alpha kinase 4
MDVRERQEDELSAVQAIYGDAYTSVTSAKPAWRNQVPLKECRIRLDALEDDLKDRVSIVLHIKSVHVLIACEMTHCFLRHRLPATYPKTAPTISLNDPIGVTAECVQGLAKLLEAKAKGLVPNEAIFELASEAASYITQHHAIIQQNVPSLIDQQAARTALESEVGPTAWFVDRSHSTTRRLQHG